MKIKLPEIVFPDIIRRKLSEISGYIEDLISDINYLRGEIGDLRTMIYSPDSTLNKGIQEMNNGLGERITEANVLIHSLNENLQKTEETVNETKELTGSTMVQMGLINQTMCDSAEVLESQQNVIDHLARNFGAGEAWETVLLVSYRGSPYIFHNGKQIPIVENHGFTIIYDPEFNRCDVSIH